MDLDIRRVIKSIPKDHGPEELARLMTPWGEALAEDAIETANADFNQLGIQMRCYFDYGASKGETKAALYSTGA